ncbi:MAG: hypothetical protein RLZ62_265 [Bacteroidota bacterium]
MRLYPILSAVVCVLLLSRCESSLLGAGSGETEQNVNKLLGQAFKGFRVTPDSGWIFLREANRLAREKSLTDTTLSNLYYMNGLGWYRRDSIYLALRDFNLSVEKAVKASSSFHEARAYTEIGRALIVQAEYESAIDYLNRSIVLYDSIGNSMRGADSRIILGSVLNDQGKYKEALKVSLEAYEILYNRNSSSLSPLCMTIATTFSALGSKEESLAYDFKALEFARKADDTGNIASALINLGVQYRHTNPDSSLYYYREALDLQRKMPYVHNRLPTLFNLGNIYMDRSDFTNANACFDSVLSISRSIGMQKGVAMALSGKAIAASRSGQYDRAAALFSEAMNMAETLADRELMLDLAQERYEMDIKSGKSSAANQSLLKLMEVKDSVASAEKRLEIYKMEQKFQSEKKLAEISRLHDDVQEREQDLRSAMIIGALLLLLSASMGVFAYFYARLSRERWNAYRQILERYEESQKMYRQTREILDELQTENRITAAQALVKKMHELFVREMPYLNPDLKVNDIADQLDVPYRTLINALKEVEGIPFNTLVNRYRIEATIRIFRDPAYSHIKTESIAQDAGFGSRSTFYSVFQEVTGLKPGHYRQLVAEKLQSPGEQ